MFTMFTENICVKRNKLNKVIFFNVCLSCNMQCINALSSEVCKPQECWWYIYTKWKLMKMLLRKTRFQHKHSCGLKENWLSKGLEQHCPDSYCSCCSEILTKSLQPPQNIHRSFKTFVCVSLRYIKYCGGGVWIVVCGKNFCLCFS